MQGEIVASVSAPIRAVRVGLLIPHRNHVNPVRIRNFFRSLYREVPNEISKHENSFQVFDRYFDCPPEVLFAGIK